MSGFTSGELLNKIDKFKVHDHCGMKACGVRAQLSNKQYDAVLLMIGTNDLGVGVTLDELTENILSLRDICLQYCPKLILFTIPSSRSRSIIEEMNERIKEIVQKNSSNTYLFDCYLAFHQKNQEFINSNNDNTSHNPFDYDGLHFSEYGSKYLGETIFSKLVDYGIN